MFVKIKYRYVNKNISGKIYVHFAYEDLIHFHSDYVG